MTDQVNPQAQPAVTPQPAGRIDPTTLGYDAGELRDVPQLGSAPEQPPADTGPGLFAGAAKFAGHAIDTIEQQGLIGGFKQLNEETRALRKGVIGDWIGTRLWRAAELSAMPPDANWSFPMEGTPEWKEIMDGVPDEQYHRFVGVTSHDQAMVVRSQILAKQEAAQSMAQYGTLGKVAYVGGQFLDPAFLALAMVPVVGQSAAAGRLANAVRAGLAVGASNAALVSLADGVEHDFNIHNAAWAGATGLLLGGIGGALMRPAERAALANNLGKQSVEAAGDEASAILERAGKPDLAREALDVKVPQPIEGDTLSAAKVDTAKSYDPMTDANIRGEHGVVDLEAAPGQSAFGKVRFTLSGLIRGSKDPWVRARFGGVVGDRVGAADGSVNTIGADEAMRQIMDVAHTNLSRVLEPAYREWAKENSINILGRLSQKARTRFGNEVRDYVEGANPDASAPVKRTGDRVASLLNDLREQAQKAGVKGFETLAENDRYLPRLWNHAEVNRLNAVYKTARMDALFTKAFKAAAPGVDDATAQLIGKGFNNRLRRLGAGMDTELLNGVRLDDVGQLREILQEAGADSDTITSTMQQVERALTERQSGKGLPTQARHRLSLDVHQKFDIWNEGTQRMDQVSLSDMLERNAESLFLRYLHPMAGRIALAKAGFKSEGDFNTAIQELLDRYRTDPKEGAKLQRGLEAARDLILGRSLDADPASRTNAILRTLRQYNVPRMMGQVAFASVQDLGGILGGGYLRTTLNHVPELYGMLRRSADGTLKGELADELESVLGLGAEHLNNMVYSHTDGLGPAASAEWAGSRLEARFDRFLAGSEHVARQLGRATSLTSGMAGLQNFLQRLTTQSIVQRMMDSAAGKVRYSQEQLAFLGMDEQMQARVWQQLRQATETTQSWLSRNKVNRLNMDKWTDLDARDAFVAAVRKEARRIIQSPDIGSTTPFMHKSWGKVLTQFRSFVIQAYDNHLLHGLNMRDLDSFTAFLATTLLSTASVAVQNHMNTLGADPNDKRIAERTTLAYILKNGIARANQLSFLPSLVDTVSTYLPFVHRPVFGFRSSGLANDIVQGNPTVDLALSLLRAGSGAISAAVEPDYKFSQGDLNAILRTLAFQNAYGMQQVHRMLAEKLPKRSLPPDYFKDEE